MTVGTLRRGSHLAPDQTTTKPATSSKHTAGPDESRDVVLPQQSGTEQSDTLDSRLATAASLDSKTVLDALLAAGGEIAVACELLGDGPGKPLPQSILIHHLADKPALLQRSLRVFAMLSTYDLFSRAGKILQTDYNKMETEALAKTYDRLSTQLDNYTAPANTGSGPATGGVSVNILLESMPKPAADAVKQLSALSPEQREGMRRAIVQRRMLGSGEPEDADYESEAVA